MAENEVVDKKITWTVPPVHKQNVISVTATTRTLTAAESGSIVLFAAVSTIITLPTPSVGLYYTFISTVSAATNQEIDTSGAAVFLQGAPNILVDNSATSKGFAGDGTGHVKYQMNGSTKGGIIGSWMRVECVTATQWQVTGNLLGSGAPATGFA